MRHTGRAFAESIVLHGTVMAFFLALAATFTAPPKTVRLDFSLLPQVVPTRKPESPAQQSHTPHPQPAQAPGPVVKSEPVSQSQTPPRPQPTAKSIRAAKPRQKIAAHSQPKKIRPSEPQHPAAALAPPPASRTQTATTDATAADPQHNLMRSPKTANHLNTSSLPGKSALAPSTSELKNYLGLLRLRIENHKRYPLRARSRRLEGVVRLRFILTPDGSITAIRVAKSSGQDCLDDAAVEAVRRASPMPPPPAGVIGRVASMELPLVFTLLR